MPVSMVICAGMARPGSTRVANSPSRSPPRTLTAPISVMPSASLAEPPVVSRSTTTKVTSDSGSPRSEKACWSVAPIVTVDTVGTTTDREAATHVRKAGPSR